MPVDVAAFEGPSACDTAPPFCETSTEGEALSPVAILERGYALVFDAEGKLVKDADQVSEGQEIEARLARGRLGAVVKKRLPS